MSAGFGGSVGQLVQSGTGIHNDLKRADEVENSHLQALKQAQALKKPIKPKKQPKPLYQPPKKNCSAIDNIILNSGVNQTDNKTMAATAKT